MFKKNLQHFRKHFLAFEILQKYYKKHKMRKNQTFQKTQSHLRKPFNDTFLKPNIETMI